MTRKETIDALGANEKLYTRSLIGKAYDHGMAEGREQGYNDGFSDANRYASKAMAACACLALHEEFGFGEQRMQRFATAFQNKLLYTIDINEAIRECLERFNLSLDDELFEED